MPMPAHPLSRRRLLQVSAAGVLTVPLAACSSGRPSENTELSQAFGGDFTWISPRGTIEVVDDYPYWVARELGYFGDLPTAMQAGPADATAVVRQVAGDQADIGFPSPGVLTDAINKDLDLVSVFGSGRLDLFDLAFRPGEGISNLKEMEGRTVLLGSSGWQSICNPMFVAAGVDHTKIKYIDAGFPGWTSALASGKGDACLAWEGLRANLSGKNLHFDYWLGRFGSKLPSNSLVVRREDLKNSQRRELIQKYLTAWAMGLEFADRNPLAATQIVFKALPAVREDLGPRYGAESLLQIHQTFKGDDFKEQASWGEHDMTQWDLFFQTAKYLGQTELDIRTTDWILNDFIAKAKSFDRKKVWADADSYKLDGDLAAVDIAKVKGHLYENVTNA